MLVMESLFQNVAGLKALLKETSTQVLSCAICKILKNINFAEHLRTAASEETRSTSKDTTMVRYSFLTLNIYSI